MSKNKCKNSYQNEWLSNELYKTWVKKVDNKRKAYCKVCMKSFSVSRHRCKSTRHTRKNEEPLAKVSSFQSAEVKILGK